MSLEQAMAFIERMERDERFREIVMAVEDLRMRMLAIHAYGYDCTIGELQSMALLPDIAAGNCMG